MVNRPALSIIVPVLDEAATLPILFRTLADQQDVLFELLLCDGGSGDGTPAVAVALAQRYAFSCRVIAARRGRARQMNAGAAAANGEYLLFLHADSRFDDPFALRRALHALATRLAARGDGRAAGHFPLRFRRTDPKPSLAYYFYECKARLDRPGCIHGDQGFLLRRSFFLQIGPFDESLPLLEDDRLADSVRGAGEWLLLPSEIVTSARRFESEGLRQRQTLNALLMNFAAIGWHAFFAAAGDLYRQQSRTRSLDLYPFFESIRELTGKLSWRYRLRLWYRTGVYVRGNAWQLALWCDSRRNFAAGLPAGTGETPRLHFFARRLDPFLDHPPGRLLAAVLTWCWFNSYRLRLRRRHQLAIQKRNEHAAGNPDIS